MYKNFIKSIFLFFVVFVVIFTNKAYASGGRNGECADAQVTGLSGEGGNAYYNTQEDLIITGVCIKAGNNMFDDGHSEVLYNGLYENGCYEIRGVGTNSIIVTRLKYGNDCKEVSHIDVYYEKFSSEPRIEAPDPVSEVEETTKEIEDKEEIKEDEKVVEDTDTFEDEVGIGGITEDDPDKDIENDEISYNNVELSPEVKAEKAEKELATITELPKTGSEMGFFTSLPGIFMVITGYLNKKKK